MKDANGNVIKLGDKVLGIANTHFKEVHAYTVVWDRGYEVHLNRRNDTSVYYCPAENSWSIKILDKMGLLKFKLGGDFTGEDWNRL